MKNVNHSHNGISPYSCQNFHCQKGKGQTLVVNKGVPCILLVEMLMLSF
jgi:hypothetical protein